MVDIILNGVNISELKRTRIALQQDASKFVSEAIEKVQDIVKHRLVVALYTTDAQAAAEEALSLLETAEIVASTAGVQFSLPYYEEYGSHDDEDILSKVIEDADHEVIGSYYKGSLGKLHALLESMESSSRDWYSSNCY